MAKKNRIRGTKRGDALMGSEDRDIVLGKGGDDVITTYGGKDKVKGGNLMTSSPQERARTKPGVVLAMISL